jgi:GT2 family glycosyltransferase
MLYVMISTQKSQHFTPVAIASLKRNTPLSGSDLVVVIDNDGSLPEMDGVHLLRNDKPRSFAENANLAINLSHVTGHDLWLLNNDIVFTPQWFSRSYLDGRSIIIPNCNQYAQYAVDGLELKSAMDLAELDNRFETLDQIAQLHALQTYNAPFATHWLLSFYCVYLPLFATKKIGHFDESFGRGGGEDVDYRLRATQAEVEVKLAHSAYLLHFMGKSTWRSGEVQEETRQRELQYRARFVEKWGQPLADIFLVGGDKRALAANYGVLDGFDRGDFVAVFNALRPR